MLEYIMVKKGRDGNLGSIGFKTHVRLLEYAIHSANEEELEQAINKIEIDTLQKMKELIEKRRE